MGGLVAKEQAAPEPADGVPNMSSKVKVQSSRGASGLRGVHAGALDSNTECFELQHLIRRLRVYQHFESGEIMLLINENLSDDTPGVTDATEWGQVFLNAQNEGYLERYKTRVAVPQDPADIQAIKDGSDGGHSFSKDFYRERKESANDPHIDNAGGLASNFNEFSLSMEKLDRNNRGLEYKRTNEHDAKHVCVFKDQRMNEEYRSFPYVPKENRESRDRRRRPKHAAEIAESKDEATSDMSDAKALTSTLPVSRTNSVERNKEECPYCNCALLPNSRRHADRNDSTDVLCPETLCRFERYVLPRFSQVDMVLQASLVELNKDNEVAMEKALVRAMRAFEKRSAMNNSTLLLIKKVMSLGNDATLMMSQHNNGSGSGSGSGSSYGKVSDPMFTVEQRIVGVGKEVQAFLLQLRNQEAKQRVEEKEEMAVVKNASNGVVGGGALTMLSSDPKNRDDDDDFDDEVGSADEDREAQGGIHRVGIDGGKYGAMPGGVAILSAGDRMGSAGADRKASFEDKEDRFFCSLKDLRRYIKVVEKVLAQCNAKKAILGHHMSMALGIRDFEFRRVLGKGGFGYVHLVRNCQNGGSYALKAISKSYLGDPSAHRQLLNEQHITYMATKHNASAFVNLNGAFQTPNFCCLVLEYCPGGDCQTLLDNVGYLPERNVMVMIAEVIQAVSWLHAHGVLHRDIKPDNIFITASGHVKLGDFGFCAQVGSKNNQHARSRAASQRSSESGTRSGVLGMGKSHSGDSSGDLTRGSGLIGSVAGSGDKETDDRGDRPSTISFDNKLWASMDSDVTLENGAVVWTKEKETPPSGSRPSSPRGYGMVQSGSTSARSVNSDPSSTSAAYAREDSNSQLYFATVGNPHYQSPECLSGLGYDRSEDWWAVGVLCFHLLAGITPFEAKDGTLPGTEDEAEKEKDNIVLAKILWENVPKEVVLSRECRDFIGRMLGEKDAERLSYHGFRGIRDHDFFGDIHFDLLWKGMGPLKLGLDEVGSHIDQEHEDDRHGRLLALWTDTNDNLANMSPTSMPIRGPLSIFKTIVNF